MLTYRLAKAEEYQDCLQLVNETAGYLEATLEHMQLSVDQFADLFRTVGQTFTVHDGDDFSGFYWGDKKPDLVKSTPVIQLSMDDTAPLL